MSRTIVGWKLAPDERAGLLARFPPRYARTVADHVTRRFGSQASDPLPVATSGVIVGEADDGHGVQALVVEIAGSTERGDGSHFHITWSLAPGRNAKESNDVMAANGWRAISPPVPLSLRPARWQG